MGWRGKRLQGLFPGGGLRLMTGEMNVSELDKVQISCR